MATITQDMRFRLALIHYAAHHGVTKTAIKYHVNRQYVYRWKNRYDGSWDSLRNRSGDHITTLGNILRKKSNSFLTCVAAIPMPAWLFSG